ncbi:MAG: NUDIX hydrolase [Nitrospinae bacterium]|nr:NUDIX hydrolase [Nitrospinota bacterium]
MGDKKRLRDWERVRSEGGPDIPLFSVQYHWMKNPRNGELLKRLVLETNDWVNIVPLTADGNIIVIRQYRFGVERIITEIPGGLVDIGEGHREAAIRELREETGYASDDWVYLGSVEPNPAIHNNRCHHWLAKGIVKVAEAELDEGEDIEVNLISVEELRSQVKSGEIRHSLVLSALSRVFDLWPNKRAP